MKNSNLLSSYNIETLYEFPNASSKSEQWLLRCGLIKKISSALYGYTSYGVIALEKLTKIFSNLLEEKKYTKVAIPPLLPKSFWYEDDIKEAFVFDENVFSPTSEPVIYKLFPNRRVYMNSWNFRNEKRGAFGLCRNISFMMQDSYFSDTNKMKAQLMYSEALGIYQKAFASLGIQCFYNFFNDEVRGDNCEFLVKSSMSTDTYKSCNDCNIINCSCESNKIENKFLEVAHVLFFKPNIWKQNFYAGSFGVGLGRLLQYLCELYCDEKGLRFPSFIEPFSTVVLSTSPKHNESALNVYEKVQSSNNNAFFDDREMSFGKKIMDLEMLGCSQIIIVGEQYKENSMLEVINRWTNEKSNKSINDILC